MKLVVVSGRSGSGKSTALNALEDQGYHCIDNLPVSLLPTLAASAARDAGGMPFAVSIDARNLPAELDRFPEIYGALRDRGDLQLEIVYLDAGLDVLVRRFSETRRRHPLTSADVHLREALEAESALLGGIANLADLVLDTTELTLHQLRDEIRQRIALHSAPGTSLMFRSFGFRGGVPVDADLVFDVRCLPNPHWIPDLRPLTGRDAEVAAWLGDEAEVCEMEGDLRAFLTRWLPAYEHSNRSYLTVAIGCTGGQHRSVFLAERLAAHFGHAGREVLVRHRELGGVYRVTGTEQPAEAAADPED